MKCIAPKEKYIFQLDKEIKTNVEKALIKGSLPELTTALSEDPYVQTKQRAEFVILLMCKEAYYESYLDKLLIFDLLYAMRKESGFEEHRGIANELLALFKLIQIGMKAPKSSAQCRY